MKTKFYISCIVVLLPVLAVWAQPNSIDRTDQKYVVLEELTGTWCSWCPRGQVTGRQLSQDYDNIIFIAIHSSDPMEYEAYSQASGLTAAPSANINRKHQGTDTGQWEGLAVQEMAVDPPAYITVSTTFDEGTRELEAIVSASFVENLSGNYRLGGLVVEDGVTGPSPSYDQSNSYSGGGYGPMGGFEDLPSPVPASMIAYDHVARQLLGGYSGEAGSLPGSIGNGENHSYTFSYTLPDDFEHDYIRVVGWLIDQNSGQILNAGKSQYLPGFDNGKPHFLSTPLSGGFVGTEYVYQVYTADPEDDGLTITATDIPSWLSFEQNAQHSVHTSGILNGTPTATGTYPITLEVTDGDWVIEQSFELVVEGSQGAAWELVGVPGCSNIETSETIICLDDEDTPFLACRNFSDPIEVLQFDGVSWSGLGTNIGNSDSDMDMAVDEYGTPWIAFNDVSAGGKAVVKKYSGGSWVTVGSPVSTGEARSIALAFDNNGVAYVGFYEQSQNYRAYVYKYTGGSWQMVGTGPIAEEITLWLRFAFDSNNTPYVLWCKAVGYSYYSRVSSFENNTWSIIGGGDITSNITYFDHEIVINNDDDVFVSISETTGTELNVYELVYGVWVKKTNSTNYIGEQHGMVVNSDGLIYLGFQNASQASQTSVVSFDGSTWESVGPVSISGSANNQSMAIASDNTPYIAYSDSDQQDKATVKAYFSSPLPIFELDLTQIVFDTTAVGYNNQQAVWVSNTGEATLEISSISTNNFIFSPNYTSMSIEAGDSLELIITFEPEDEQLYEGEITLLSNDPDNDTQIIEVSGYGIISTNIGTTEETVEPVLFPNPCVDFCTITMNSKISRMQIINSSGKIETDRIPGSNQITMNTSRLPKGLYFVKLYTDDEIHIRKLVIH